MSFAQMLSHNNDPGPRSSIIMQPIMIKIIAYTPFY